MLSRNSSLSAFDRAFDFAKSWIDSGQPFPVAERASHYYSVGAYSAAVAGDFDQAEKYLASATVAPAADSLGKRNNLFAKALITAMRGDSGKAWTMITPILGANFFLTPQFFAIHPYYRHLFGDLPAYQEYIAQAN